MSDNVQSAMFEILKRIQSDVSEVKSDVAVLKIDVASLKGDVGSLKGDFASLKADVSILKSDMGAVKRSVAGLEKTFTHLDARVERVERIITQQRRDNAGMLVMMRATAGAFDERMLIMEEEMRLLKEPAR